MKMSSNVCVNVKLTMHCVKNVFQSISECRPCFEDMELLFIMLKHGNMKLAKFPIKGYDSRKKIVV